MFKTNKLAKNGFVFWGIIIVGILVLVFIITLFTAMFAGEKHFGQNPLVKKAQAKSADTPYDDTGYFNSGYMFDNNAATATEIDKVLSGTKMAGFGAAIKKTADKYHLNPVYIAAHAALESGWGKSKIAQDKNNYFGYMAYDSCPYECAKTYPNFEACVDNVMGDIKTGYLTPGGDRYNGATLEGMNVKYATSKTWAYSIKNIMLEMYEKIGKNPPSLMSGDPNIT